MPIAGSVFSSSNKIIYSLRFFSYLNRKRIRDLKDSMVHVFVFQSFFSALSILYTISPSFLSISPASSTPCILKTLTPFSEMNLCYIVSIDPPSSLQKLVIRSYNGYRLFEGLVFRISFS